MENWSVFRLLDPCKSRLIKVVATGWSVKGDFIKFQVSFIRHCVKASLRQFILSAHMFIRPLAFHLQFNLFREDRNI